MTPIPHNVRFRAVPVGNKNTGTTESYLRLRCDVTWSGQRVLLGVGYHVSPKGWNSNTQRCAPRSVHGKSKTPAMSINAAIDRMEEDVDAIFSDFSRQDIIPSKAQFKEAYDVLTNKMPRPKNSFYDVYDAFIMEGQAMNRWTDSSVRVVKWARDSLKFALPDLTFEDVESKGLDFITKHLIARPTRHIFSPNNDEKRLNNSSIHVNIEKIRSFLRWAQSKGYCNVSNILDERTKVKDVANKTIVYLTWDELMRVYHFNFYGYKNRQSLEISRDILCFCAFTSLRYSDVMNLKKSDFHGESFTITIIKTGTVVTIELNKYSKAIYEKYKITPGATLFTTLSFPRYGRHIRSIGKICGIDTPVSQTRYIGNKRCDVVKPKYELMTSHIGRRTFISNAITLGIPPNVVMKWTGHSDYESMKPYIDIVDSAKRDAMGKFDSK